LRNEWKHSWNDTESRSLQGKPLGKRRWVNAKLRNQGISDQAFWEVTLEFCQHKPAQKAGAEMGWEAHWMALLAGK